MSKQVVKNQSIIIPASKRDVKSIQIDNREIKMGNHGTFVNDSGLAEEIAARHNAGKKGELSKDVVVVKDVPVIKELGHTYFFGSMPEMPWKRKKENENG